MSWRNILLIMLAVVLIISGVVNVYYVTLLNEKESEINQKNIQLISKTSEINDLQFQVNSLNSKITSLNSQIDNLENDITYKDAEIARLNSIIENLKEEASQRDTELLDKDDQIRSLESQVSSLNYQIADLMNELEVLKAPKLVNVGMGAHDNRENVSQPFLELEGAVVNVGRKTAYNCKLKIIAYQGNDQSIFILDLNPKSIEGLASAMIKTNIYYSGAPISMSKLIITPEWTDTP